MNVTTRVTRDSVLPQGRLFDQDDWYAIGGILRMEIEEGIETQTDVNGLPYPVLKPNTIASKQAKGSAQPTKRLIDKGNLKRSTKFTAGSDRVVATLGPQRELIGAFHQEGIRPHPIVPKEREGWLRFVTTRGVTFAKAVLHPGTAPVEFFGISRQAAGRILAFAQAKIDRWLRNTRR